MWRPRQDSNLRPSVPETGALSPELRGLGLAQATSEAPWPCDRAVGKDADVKERIKAVIAWGSRLSREYTRTRASLAAGGLAYFVALSLAPAALAFGTLAGLFLDPADVREVLDRLAERAPGSVGDLQPLIEALVSTVETASASAFTLTTVVSVLIAIYASSKVVFGVRMAMNTVFEVEETRSGLVERGIATVITLVGLVAGVAVVVVLTILPKMLEWLGIIDVRLTTGNWVADWLIVLVITFLAVRWILHHAPNRDAAVPWTSRGAVIATLGIGGATVGVGLYARFSSSLSTAVLLFGTAVVILLWLYLCFVALLWGAIIEADDARTRTSEGDRPPAP
jgi:membrane protein